MISGDMSKLESLIIAIYNVGVSIVVSKPGGRDFSTSQSASLVYICKQLQGGFRKCTFIAALVYVSVIFQLNSLSIDHVQSQPIDSLL